MKQQTFWSLVQNDLKQEAEYKNLILGFVGGLILLIFLNMIHIIHVPIQFLFFLYLLISVQFAERTITKEWNAGTELIWRCIPISRSALIGTKFVAAFIRSIKVFFLFYILFRVTDISGIMTWFGQEVRLNKIVGFLLRDISFIFYIIGLTPFFVTCGLLIGILKQSSFRRFHWLLFSVIGIATICLGIVFRFTLESTIRFLYFFILPTYSLYIFAMGLLFSLLFYWISVIVFSRFTES